MGRNESTPCLRLSFNLFLGYPLLITCLISVQTNAAVRGGSNGTAHVDQCCSTEMTSSNSPDMNKSELSFTEEFIARRTGRNVNIKKLLMTYSSVCPLQETCGVNINRRFLFSGSLPNTGCNQCTCNISCVYHGNCCPGAHYGYVGHKCSNLNLYPKTPKNSHYMVRTCLESYNENKTIITLCRERVEPCTGTESKLIYRNKYCGKCNKELDCIPWKIRVECSNATEFEKEISTLSSIMDVKSALDLNKCRIRFQLPKFLPNVVCDGTRNDYLGIVRIDKCNVSGFWETYDEDLDWACANFIIPFKHFKNVFCYICNPSTAKMQPGLLINICRQARNSFESEVNKACQSFPVADRLAPFKNIYCYVCSHGDTFLFEENTYSVQYVKEDNTLTLQSHLDIAIKISGGHNYNLFKTFVQDVLIENFNEIKQGISPNTTKKQSNDAPDFNEIVKDYTAICGTSTFCSRNTDINSTDTFYGNPVCQTCTCDSFCAENGSCCPDYLFNREPYSCYSSRIFSSMYKYQNKLTTPNISSDRLITCSYQIINKCLNENVTPSTKKKCSLFNNTSDRLSRIPVSTETGMTYKNIYCYACNNNKSAITLKFQVLCKTYIEHKLFLNIDNLLNVIKHYCEAITFVPVNNKLCLDKYDSWNASLTHGEKFIRRELHPSQFEFKVVKFIKRFRDFDKPVKTVFDSCNKTGLYQHGTNDSIVKICESNDVNLMSLPEYRVNNKVYKNFACFLCNPEHDLSAKDFDNVTSRCLSNNAVEWYEPNDALEKLCNETEFYWRWYPFKNLYCADCNLPPWQLVNVIISPAILSPAAGYKYIFSLSSADFEHLDEFMETESIPDCTPGTYDYAQKHCRQLSCNDGFQLFNSTCKPLLEYAVRHEYSLSFDIHFSADDTLNMSKSNQRNKSVIVDFETLCSKIVDDVTGHFGETTEYFIKQKLCLASPCEHLHHNAVFGKRIQYVDLIRIDTFHVLLNISIIKTNAISIVHTALLNALNRRFIISDIPDNHGIRQTVHINSSSTNIQKEQLQLTLMQCIHHSSLSYPIIDSLQYSYYTVDTFLTCGQIKLNISEVWLDMISNSISLKNINATFTATEYKVVHQNVIICVADYDRKTYTEPAVIKIVRTDPIKSVFIVFSFVCTIVSLLCVFLTFITYFCISSLRTIAGKNIMALCVSLFFSQALLQFGINATKITTLCVAVGILIHFFWLVTFCAMNICSFHTFKVFYYNNIIINKSGNYLFLKYSLYMICFPVFLVSANIFASLIKTEFSDIGYGKYYCFISYFDIFLITFITPASLIFLSNIVFFSIAFHTIRSSPNVRGRRDRNNFNICLRLCTIVGIAWPLLIIDSSLGITWFSFIVAGVNALQGVFIFGSFVLNRRVASMCVSSIRKPTGQ